MTSVAQNKWIDLLKYNSVRYDSEKQFLQKNNIDRDDFNEWKQRGCSEDGFVEVISHMAAGNATTNEYLPITSWDNILDLIACEIDESNFYELIEELNEDPSDGPQIDENDFYQVLETYLEWISGGAGQIAIFPLESDKSGSGLCLVIMND